MMRLVFKFLGKIALNAGALWIAAHFIKGFAVEAHAFGLLSFLNVSPAVQSLIAGGMILAILNMFIRPVLKVISFPFILLTFGLFTIVINLLILFIADWYFGSITVTGFQAYFFGSLIIAIANTVL